MPWPPVIPPATRANATPQLDTHPSDHNAISAALTDLVTRVNALPAGHLAYVEQTVVQTGITPATVDLTSMTITFTLATQRRVQLTANIWYTKAGADTTGVAFAQIATAANVEVQGRGTHVVAGGWGTVSLQKLLTLAAGTYTYKCRGSTAAGFLNTGSSAAEPSILQAIDLGAG